MIKEKREVLEKNDISGLNEILINLFSFGCTLLFIAFRVWLKKEKTSFLNHYNNI